MASFKICVSDPKTGKTYQEEAKDAQAQPFIGKNIGETIKGESFDLVGYELQITGGSDFCGFPMRSGILGVRKRVSLEGGVGFRGADKGIKKRKTVCGHKINESIVQINLKVTKQGTKKLTEALGVQEKPKEEGKAEEKKEEKPKEEKKEEPKKEAKPKEKPKEEKKEEPKKEEKPKK